MTALVHDGDSCVTALVKYCESMAERPDQVSMRTAWEEYGPLRLVNNQQELLCNEDCTLFRIYVGTEIIKRSAPQFATFTSPMPYVDWTNTVLQEAVSALEVCAHSSLHVIEYALCNLLHSLRDVFHTNSSLREKYLLVWDFLMSKVNHPGSIPRHTLLRALLHLAERGTDDKQHIPDLGSIVEPLLKVYEASSVINLDERELKYLLELLRARPDAPLLDTWFYKVVESMPRESWTGANGQLIWEFTDYCTQHALEAYSPLIPLLPFMQTPTVLPVSRLKLMLRVAVVNAEGACHRPASMRELGTLRQLLRLNAPGVVACIRGAAGDEVGDDDQIITILHLCLMIYQAWYKCPMDEEIMQENGTDLDQSLYPSALLHSFLESIGFDVTVVIDMMLADTGQEWLPFFFSALRQIAEENTPCEKCDQITEFCVELKKKLDRYRELGLFPYDCSALITFLATYFCQESAS